MLAFYLASERGMLNLFPRARYILSTQPVVNPFAGDFNDIYRVSGRLAGAQGRDRKADQGRSKAISRSMRTRCAAKPPRIQPTLIFSTTARCSSSKLVDEEAARGRSVEYYNIGTLFPVPRSDRMPYFIDPVHLTDKGMDVIGKFYAEKILAADHERPAAAQVSPLLSLLPLLLRLLPLPLLPPAASASAAPANTEDHTWDYLVGLTVKDETAEAPVVAGFQPRRLTATPTASRHGLGVRFDNLKPGGTYHLTVWLKSAPSAWAMVEGRDSNDPTNGRSRALRRGFVRPAESHDDQIVRRFGEAERGFREGWMGQSDVRSRDQGRPDLRHREPPGRQQRPDELPGRRPECRVRWRRDRGAASSGDRSGWISQLRP